MTPRELTRAALRRITRRQIRADRHHRRTAAVCAFLAGAIASPFLAAVATAHTTATSCTHGTVGVWHVQSYTIGTYAAGYHWHTVGLRHRFGDTLTYDGVRHNHATGECAT